MTARRSPQDRARRLHLADASVDIIHEPEPDLDAVTGLLVPAGECAQCKEHVERRVVIRLVPGASGPGWSQYGCIPCTRTLSRRALAPDWLREDVARLEAAGL